MVPTCRPNLKLFFPHHSIYSLQSVVGPAKNEFHPIPINQLPYEGIFLSSGRRRSFSCTAQLPLYRGRPQQLTWVGERRRMQLTCEAERLRLQCELNASMLISPCGCEWNHSHFQDIFCSYWSLNINQHETDWRLRSHGFKTKFSSRFQ